VLIVALMTLLLWGHIADSLDALKFRKDPNSLRFGVEKPVSEHERDLLVHMTGRVAPGSLVLVKPDFSAPPFPFIDSAHGLRFKDFQHLASPPARKDTVELDWAGLVSDSGIANLQQKGVSYIVISGREELAFQISLLPSIFRKRYENPSYALFELASEPGISHVATGNTHLLSGEWDEAITQYRQALALNPDDALAYFGLGQVYEARARTEEAQVAYRRAIEANPGYMPARISLAEIYAAQGNTEAAIDQLR